MGRGDKIPCPIIIFDGMDIQQVADIIRKISDGLEETCRQCLQAESPLILDLIREQLFSGVDGDEQYLSPTYDDDPFFNLPGQWYHHSQAYKKWKSEITPPMVGVRTDLPARPENVPNLTIDNTFYSELNARLTGDGLDIDPGIGNGPDIVGKYGDRILFPGPTAVEYFNIYKMIPAIGEHFEKCGYR